LEYKIDDNLQIIISANNSVNNQVSTIEEEEEDEDDDEEEDDDNNNNAHQFDDANSELSDENLHHITYDNNEDNFSKTSSVEHRQQVDKYLQMIEADLDAEEDHRKKSVANITGARNQKKRKQPRRSSTVSELTIDDNEAGTKPGSTAMAKHYDDQMLDEDEEDNDQRSLSMDIQNKQFDDTITSPIMDDGVSAGLEITSQQEIFQELVSPFSKDSSAISETSSNPSNSVGNKKLRTLSSVVLNSKPKKPKVLRQSFAASTGTELLQATKRFLQQPPNQKTTTKMQDLASKARESFLQVSINGNSPNSTASSKDRKTSMMLSSTAPRSAGSIVVSSQELMMMDNNGNSLSISEDPDDTNKEPGSGMFDSIQEALAKVRAMNFDDDTENKVAATVDAGSVDSGNNTQQSTEQFFEPGLSGSFLMHQNTTAYLNERAANPLQAITEQDSALETSATNADEKLPTTSNHEKSTVKTTKPSLKVNSSTNAVGSTVSTPKQFRFAETLVQHQDLQPESKSATIISKPSRQQK
jgi:hypothetical protein